MIYGDRLSTDDTVRNATVCGGTVGNAYAHRLAHLFSLSIATYPPFHLVSCCVPVRHDKSQPSRTDSYGLSDPMNVERRKKNERVDERRQAKFSSSWSSRNSYLDRTSDTRRNWYASGNTTSTVEFVENCPGITSTEWHVETC